VFSNDLDQSLEFSVEFIAAILVLPLVLARLDQPHDLTGALVSAVRRISPQSRRDRVSRGPS